MSQILLYPFNISSLADKIQSNIPLDTNFKSGDYAYDYEDKNSPLYGVTYTNENNAKAWIVACKPGYCFNTLLSGSSASARIYNNTTSSNVSMRGVAVGTYDYDTNKFTLDKNIKDANGNMCANAFCIRFGTRTNVRVYTPEHWIVLWGFNMKGTWISLTTDNVSNVWANPSNYQYDPSFYESLIVSTVSTKYNITNSLTNCTNSNTATQVNENDPYTATISPTNNYNLDSITVTMGGIDITSSVVTESNNTYSISIASVTGDVSITASASATPVVRYTITNTLATETTNTNPVTDVVEHSSYSAEILIVDTESNPDNKAFTFKVDTLTVTMGGADVTSSVVTKVNDWDYTISIADITGDVVITATSTQILTEKLITYNIPNSQNNIAELSNHLYTMQSVNRNMSGHISNALADHLFRSPVTSGATAGTKIYIWADEGYGIKTSDVANANIDFDFNFVREYTDNGVTKVATCTLTKDNILWVGDVTEYYNDGTTTPIEYEGATYYRGMVIDLQSAFNLTYSEAIKLYPNVLENMKFIGEVFSLMGGIPKSEFPMCYVYNPTYAQLEQVATARYNTPSSGTQEGTTIDLSKYIIKVYKTYVDFEVGENPSDVILGNTNSNVLSDVILRNPVIDCGIVTLTEGQKNVLDYSPFAKLEIYLPFIGIKELDIDVIRGKEIQLIYKVNVMSGKCLAVLQYNNIPLYQFEGTIGEDIPFATNTESVDFGSIRAGSDNPLSMGTNYAYYILTTNKGYAPDKDIDGLAQYESGVIGNYTGYVRINNVELETSATEDEKKKIENLLKLGVVIEQAQTSTTPSNDLYPGQ